MIAPTALSRQLRTGRSARLRTRRIVASPSLTAMGALGLVTLYQLGIIEHLPEPPLPHFDADRVDASPEAYARLATPDAALGLASYAVTLCLVAMGGERRAETRPWIPLALASKVALDVLASGKLAVDQWTRHRAFCFWCLLAATASFATAPLVVPEAVHALARVRPSRPTHAQPRR